MTIGEYIRKKRIDKNLSQQQTAILLGISQSTFSRIENDIQRPTYEQLMMLYQIIGISLDFYFKNYLYRAKKY